MPKNTPVKEQSNPKKELEIVEEPQAPVVEDTAPEVVEDDPTKCPGCKGEGITHPNAIKVCAKCEGTGKA